jgi:hypothetical protein
MSLPAACAPVGDVRVYYLSFADWVPTRCPVGAIGRRKLDRATIDAPMPAPPPRKVGYALRRAVVPCGGSRRVGAVDRRFEPLAAGGRASGKLRGG